MTTRTRVVLLATIVLVVSGAATVYGVASWQRYAEQHSRPPRVATTDVRAVQSGPRIVFRHTGIDNSYGRVAMVPLDAPGSARAFTEAVCDRVAAWPGGASCLVTEGGMATSFSAQELDSRWRVATTRPLPGIPSRTQVSPDGRLVGTTSFVTGHSYMTQGFATATEVRETGDGRDFGNLETFTLRIGGRVVAAADRNIWGVTFADGDRFYATVGTGGRTWLVEGDLSERTLTSVTSDAECPSLSPDGSRVAFKVDVEPGAGKVWGLAVLDLDTGRRTELGHGPRGVDDQVAWLDDDTLIYGLPRPDEAGVTDVWAVDTEPTARPRLLIEEAWSPTVIR